MDCKKKNYERIWQHIRECENHVACAYDAIKEEIAAHSYLNASNLATWLLSMVAGCIQPTLSSFSGEVTLCSCMNVKVSWQRPKFVLPCLAEFDKYFHSRARRVFFCCRSESRFDSTFAGLPVFWLQRGSRSQVVGFFVVVKSLWNDQLPKDSRICSD